MTHGDRDPARTNTDERGPDAHAQDRVAPPLQKTREKTKNPALKCRLQILLHWASNVLEAVAEVLEVLNVELQAVVFSVDVTRNQHRDGPAQRHPQHRPRQVGVKKDPLTHARIADARRARVHGKSLALRVFPPRCALGGSLSGSSACRPSGYSPQPQDDGHGGEPAAGGHRVPPRCRGRALNDVSRGKERPSLAGEGQESCLKGYWVRDARLPGRRCRRGRKAEARAPEAEEAQGPEDYDKGVARVSVLGLETRAQVVDHLHPCQQSAVLGTAALKATKISTGKRHCQHSRPSPAPLRP